MLDIYSQFRSFHVFRKFKCLLEDWWNMDIPVVVKDGKRFFYDPIDNLNNPVVKVFLSHPVFRNYFLRSVSAVLKREARPAKTGPRLVSWRQSGLSCYVVPLFLKGSASVRACLCAVGFAPSQPKTLIEALSYSGLSAKAAKQKVASLKSLSSTDEVYIRKMLQILAEEFFDLVQERRKKEQTIERLQHKISRRATGGFAGQSQAMDFVFNILEKLKNYDGSLFIDGEEGTGKRLLARVIHDQSSRAKKPFYVQDFASLNGKIPENIVFKEPAGVLKSERQKKPLLEKIDGGSLVIHEIGSSGPAFQRKLLVLLKEGRFALPGQNKWKKANIRLVLCSSQSLSALLEKKLLIPKLADCFQALNIKIPPLRQRSEDIPLLAKRFLQAGGDKSAKKRLSLPALRALSNYHWPGNVRELKEEMEKALLFIPKGQSMVLDRDLSPHIRRPFSYPGVFVPGKHKLKEALQTVEKRILLSALRKNKGNRTHTARMLGISRTSVIMKAEEYGIKEAG